MVFTRDISQVQIKHSVEIKEPCACQSGETAYSLVQQSLCNPRPPLCPIPILKLGALSMRKIKILLC